MNNPAIGLIHPAAACPEWCVSTHVHDWMVPRESGDWNVLHESAGAVVYTAEQVSPGLTDNITVRTERYTCETPISCYPRSVAMAVVSTYGHEVRVTLTALQALHLAAVLAQQGTAVIAEEVDTEGGAGR